VWETLISLLSIQNRAGSRGKIYPPVLVSASFTALDPQRVRKIHFPVHFHPPSTSGSSLFSAYGIPVTILLRKIQLDDVILRWKKTTRALKNHEQEHGRYLTEILEKRTDAELVYFSDPVEAAAFFCMLEMVKRIGKSEGCPWQPSQRELPLNCR
jgi:hypothetical protein